MNDQKKLLIDAIVGHGCRSMSKSVELEKAGFMRFTGNQHNQSWQFKRERLAQMSESELQALYDGLDTE